MITLWSLNVKLSDRIGNRVCFGGTLTQLLSYMGQFVLKWRVMFFLVLFFVPAFTIAKGKETVIYHMEWANHMYMYVIVHAVVIITLVDHLSLKHSISTV